MRVIIAGSRTVTDYSVVVDAVNEARPDIDPAVVISGAARGVDRLGEEWAMVRHIPIERYPADWEKYGRSAGPIRNQEMAEKADALIAIWDGKSRGTKHMIDYATKKGLAVYVHKVEGV